MLVVVQTLCMGWGSARAICWWISVNNNNGITMMCVRGETTMENRKEDLLWDPELES